LADIQTNSEDRGITTITEVVITEEATRTEDVIITKIEVMVVIGDKEISLGKGGDTVASTEIGEDLIKSLPQGDQVLFLEDSKEKEILGEEMANSRGEIKGKEIIRGPFQAQITNRGDIRETGGKIEVEAGITRGIKGEITTQGEIIDGSRVLVPEVEAQ